MNNWYQIKILFGEKVVRIWDSLKKFPGLGVNGVAKLYGIEGKKEKPYFDLYRPVGYKPTKAEIDYCIQDSKIIAYAINKELEQGHNKMTLSSDAFTDVKNTIGGFKGWRKWFPELGDYYEQFTRASYKGGFVYVNPRFQNRLLSNVTVYDVNSLYPYVMHDCMLPYGKPTYRKPFGNEQFVIMFDAEFTVKDGYLPTVQVKHNRLYDGTEYLTESRGVIEGLHMTSIDYKLFTEHYDITYMSEPEYICFNSKVGLLAPYIDKWMEIKEQAVREGRMDLKYIAKRWLNSPYGKTGMNPDRVNKVPVMCDDGILEYREEQEKAEAVYVPYASFVCAQARNITIRSAQKEFDNFVYADTDSLHLLGTEHDELDVHPTHLGKWKNEGTFELAKYLRPKTYIHGHFKRLNNWINEIAIDDIKCAGMTDTIKETVQWEDFELGHDFGESKLLQYSCKGGCYLRPTRYRINSL